VEFLCTLTPMTKASEVLCGNCSRANQNSFICLILLNERSGLSRLIINRFFHLVDAFAIVKRRAVRKLGFRVERRLPVLKSTPLQLAKSLFARQFLNWTDSGYQLVLSLVEKCTYELESPHHYAEYTRIFCFLFHRYYLFALWRKAAHATAKSLGYSSSKQVFYTFSKTKTKTLFLFHESEISTSYSRLERSKLPVSQQYGILELQILNPMTLYHPC
jgi:hypothetical protein